MRDMIKQVHVATTYPITETDLIDKYFFEIQQYAVFREGDVMHAFIRMYHGYAPHQLIAKWKLDDETTVTPVMCLRHVLTKSTPQAELYTNVSRAALTRQGYQFAEIHNPFGSEPEDLHSLHPILPPESRKEPMVSQLASHPSYTNPRRNLNPEAAPFEPKE